MKFIGANADNWAFEGSVESIVQSDYDVRQTIFLVHSSYFEGILPI